MIILAQGIVNDNDRVWLDWVLNYSGARILLILITSTMLVLGKQKKPVISRRAFKLYSTGATGFEPAISGLTGQHVNRYTTPPDTGGIIP